MLQKNSMNEEAMQLLRRILILYFEHDIEVQANWISTKHNSLAYMLLCGQYTKIADRWYLFIQIAQSTFGSSLKAGI